MTNSETDIADDENRSRTLITRRRAIRAASFAAGAGLVGGAGLWYSSQPVVASEGIVEPGAENVEFGTDENIISVTAVDIAPEIDVAFSNFSSGVVSAEIEITLQVDAEQTDDETYTGTQDTWGAPSEGLSDSITISDTIATDGTEQTWDPAIDSVGTFTVSTPDLTSQTDAVLGENDHFLFTDAIPVDDVLGEDAAIDNGTEMFPQDIDPDSYGLSVVDADYSITLTGEADDADTDDSPLHEFNVAVENEGGTIDDSEVDSNTDGEGTDGA